MHDTSTPLRLVIVNDASVARGGATGLALLQATLAAERGIDVTFVSGDGGTPPGLAEQGVTCLGAGSAPLTKAAPLTAATRGLYNRASHALLRRLIAERDTPGTVYHVHGFSKALSPSIFAALQPVAARTFIHAHDFFLACPNGGFMDYGRREPCGRVPLSAACLATNCDKRSYGQKLWRVARQAVLHRTMPRGAPWAGILMIHPDMAAPLGRAGYPPGVLRTLRNPVRAFRTKRVEAERNARFVFIGRIEAEKGIEELLAAAGLAKVPLQVIGEGPLLARLRAEHPAVDFTGWLEREQIAAAIGAARALVMPSRYPEPFGLVVAEASLSGVPVILSDTAYLAREVAAAGLGFACDTRDPATLAANLRRMADLPNGEVEAMSRRGTMGEAALGTTPEAWIEAQIALWRAVADGASAEIHA